MTEKQRSGRKRNSVKFGHVRRMMLWRDDAWMGPLSATELIRQGIRSDDSICADGEAEVSFANKEPYIQLLAGANPNGRPEMGHWRVTLSQKRNWRYWEAGSYPCAGCFAMLSYAHAGLSA